MAAHPSHWQFENAFDGGDTGCGELIIELARHFRAQAPAARVLVTARDPGAPLDLPAWCRQTGHALLESSHPHYLIRRRD